MSLVQEGIPVSMQVQPASYNNGNCNGWGGDWGAWIILFLIFGMFGWGGFGGGFGGYGNGVQGALTRADLCSEFNFNNLESGVRGVQQGICDSTFALNNSINGTNMALANGFSGVNNAICSLGYQTQQGFNATQVALMQGQNALQSQLADCCCQTQRAIDNVNYNAATNACAIQNTIQTTTRNVIENDNRNHQSLMDKLCQMEYNSLNDKYQAAMSENQALRFQLSQGAQNAAIGAMISASEATILRRTGAECPQACYVVQPPQPVSFNTNCAGQASFANNCCNNGFNNGYCC